MDSRFEGTSVAWMKRAGTGAACGLIAAALAAGCSRPPATRAAASDAGTSRDAADGNAGDGAPEVPWVWRVSCPDGHEPADPIDYGRCAVDQALAEAHATRAIQIATIDTAASGVRDAVEPALDARPESFVTAPLAATTWVVGRDAVGAMYGALQLAERIRLDGAGGVPPAASSRGAPAVAFRAANLFWVLPEAGETSWWFLDEGFWRDYLDLLAHARLDVLDLHGMYDLASTNFPNALLYLARSASFPDVGAPAADRDRNLAMLNRVVAGRTASRRATAPSRSTRSRSPRPARPPPT